MTRLFLCTADQVEADGVTKIDLSGRAPIAVYNLDGAFYATDNLCTHGEASLAEGEVVSGQIICPFHGGSFDIKTGDPTGSPCIVPLKTYPVHTDGDKLYIDLD